MESELKKILKLCSGVGGTPEMLPELLKGQGLQSDFERLHSELMDDYQCVNT